MEEAGYFSGTWAYAFVSCKIFPTSVVDVVLTKGLMTSLQLLGDAVLSLGPLLVTAF